MQYDIYIYTQMYRIQNTECSDYREKRLYFICFASDDSVAYIVAIKRQDFSCPQLINITRHFKI